ncbi:MAG: cell division protein FtsQ/DivIB, partial [Vulcanimicrobiaceae bacterium]
MSARVQTRPLRRSARPLHLRLRAYWLLGLALLAGAAWGGWALARAPALRVSRIEVAGNRVVSRSEILAAAGLDWRENAWLVPLGPSVRRIDALPWIATATIARRLPATLAIAVVERTPFACVRAPGQAFTIDASDRVLARGCTRAPAPRFVLRAPLAVAPGRWITNPELATLEAHARTLGRDGERYVRFAYDRFGELEATLANGLVVHFDPDRDFARAAGEVAPVLAQLGARRAQVRGLDLRAPQT